MAGIVETQTRDCWRPFYEQRDQTAFIKSQPRERLGHERDSESGFSGLDHQAVMIESQHARHVYGEFLGVARELPAIRLATSQALTNATVPV